MPGEKDWVYGIVASGRQRQTGDRISVDDPVTIQVGNGQVSSSDDIDVVDGSTDIDLENGQEDGFVDEGGDVDEFHEVTEPTH